MTKGQKMKNQIYETKNYDMFSLINGNRIIRKDRVKKLQKDIEAFAQKNPILVTADKGVLDGQYRLTACKNLSIPVKYIVDDQIHSSDQNILDLIRAINKNQANWTAVNVGNSYAVSEDNEYYKRYMDLINLGVSHSFVLHACAEFSKGKPDVKCTNKNFKSGEFVMPLEVYEMVKGLIKMLKSSGISPKIWNRQYFIRALMKLRKVKEFDTYRFIENFERFPYEWKDAYQTMDNLRSILHVHNYRNRDKAKYFIE
jgi:hypothetical protein